MGIPYLFASLLKKHSSILTKLPKKIDYLGIDMNCFIHHYLDPENPLESVISGFKQFLLQISIEDENIFIAFDGLVPLAKIVQQRYRRFREDNESFDKRQISPDTPYMRELENKFQKEFPNIRISSTKEKGEGEHKIFLDLKNKSYKNIVIYGLDADLILLSVASEKSIFLLRENIDEVVNINILRNVLPIPYKQFIYLSMFFGNDFLPSLTIFSLREKGYERALEFYKESGNPDLSTEKGRQQFLEYSSEKEFSILNFLIKKRNNIFEKCILSSSKEECSRKYNLHILDGVLNVEPVIEAYWKTYDFCITYFFTNIPKNWDWYYSYPESPLIQDIIYFSETILEESNLSYTIKNQLQFILPSKTLHLIGRRIKFHDEFYIETREPWLKRYDWETKPRISLPWGTTTSIKRIY